MKLDWIDIILILLGLFIAYQLVKAIIGRSWQSEALIIALLMFTIGVTWKISMNLMKLNMRFNGHISWHKAKEKD